MSVAVSIVVPAYNAERYLAATVESVLAQSFRDYELLIVDDCSTDGTAAMVESFAARDGRIRLVRLPKNRGAPAGPRNEGVRIARGEWIAFLDADDIWHPEKLALQMQLIASTGTQFCSARMIDFLDDKDLKLGTPGPVRYEKLTFMRNLIKMRVPTSSVVAKRALLLRVPFNEDPRYKAREDFDCWLRCHEEIGTSIKILQPLVGYRIIPGQISGKKWVMVRRHLLVLSEYRRRSGRALGLGAYFFTASHFLLSIYYRTFKKTL